jgi:hypothetical protein
LNFSVVISRLTDQTKVLAQRVALLEERQGRLERERETEAEPSPSREAEHAR